MRFVSSSGAAFSEAGVCRGEKGTHDALHTHKFTAARETPPCFAGENDGAASLKTFGSPALEDACVDPSFIRRKTCLLRGDDGPEGKRRRCGVGVGDVLFAF